MSEFYPYTESDQETWRVFFGAIETVWRKHASILHPWYLEHVDCLKPWRQRIPSLGELNQILQPIGWRAQYVKGLAPAWNIARMLHRKIMPVSVSIRSSDQVFFAYEPDLIHDIFGHLPSLLDARYRECLARWSSVAARVPVSETDRATYHTNKQIVQVDGKVAPATLDCLQKAASELRRFAEHVLSPTLLFEKLYFWIFEFGLIKQADQLQVLGAGLISSLRELTNLAEGQPVIRTLDLQTISAPYNISNIQDHYYAMSNQQHMEALISAVIQRASEAQRRPSEVMAHA